MPGTTSTALPFFSHDQHHGTDATNGKWGWKQHGILTFATIDSTQTVRPTRVKCDHLFVDNNLKDSISLQWLNNKRQNEWQIRHALRHYKGSDVPSRRVGRFQRTRFSPDPLSTPPTPVGIEPTFAGWLTIKPWLLFELIKSR